MLLEDFGFPVPGETILILGAVCAGTGRLNVLVVVAVVGLLAAIIGDNVGFAIGHLGGRSLVERFGRYVLLTSERVDRATGSFTRHGGKIIVVARFIPRLRQANGIVAGISEMHWARFLVFNALGAALWVSVWVALSYLSGNHISTIYPVATRYSAYVAIAAGVFVIAYVARRLWRRRAGSG